MDYTKLSLTEIFEILSEDETQDSTYWIAIELINRLSAER